MDSTRFGRALGAGARAAAKTLVTAVDAATAPNPSAAKGQKQEAGSVGTAANAAADKVGPAAAKVERTAARVEESVIRTVAQVQSTSQGLREGSRRFGEAVGKPLVKLSGVLWLELTGVFFGLFAVAAGGAAWRLRAAMHETAGNHDEHVRFLVALVVAVVFGYFCVSSFVQANRRSREG